VTTLFELHDPLEPSLRRLNRNACMLNLRLRSWRRS
jgi:hypothetical protein